MQQRATEAVATTCNRGFKTLRQAKPSSTVKSGKFMGAWPIEPTRCFTVYIFFGTDFIKKHVEFVDPLFGTVHSLIQVFINDSMAYHGCVTR